MKTDTILSAYIRAYDHVIDNARHGTVDPRKARQARKFLYLIRERGRAYDWMRRKRVTA